MEAIRDCKAPLTSISEAVRIYISLIKQDLQNLREGTFDAEHRMSNLEKMVQPIGRKMN